jgi:hypothetical protein
MPNCNHVCPGCVNLEEGKRYSISVDGGALYIREADSDRGGYVLSGLGGVQSTLDEDGEMHEKLTFVLSFKEKK